MPSTTPRGYPYPLPTEPVAEGAQAIRSLAETLDAKSAVDLIETKVLAAAGALSFASIPQIYRDLQIRATLRSSLAGTTIDAVAMYLNGISSASYYGNRVYGFGATTTSDESMGSTFASVGDIPGSGFTAVWGTLVIDLLEYRGSHYKAWLSQATSSGAPSGAGRRMMTGGYSIVTAAITQVNLGAVSGGTLAIGSRASLYGIRG